MSLLSGNKSYTKYILLVILVLAIVVLTALSPLKVLFHDILLWIAFTVLTIPNVVVVLGFILCCVFAYFARQAWVFWICVVVWAIFSLVWMPYSHAKVNQAIATDMPAFEVQLDDLTTTDLRIFPVDVVKAAVEDVNERSQSSIGDLDPVLTDTFQWIAPAVPKGLRWWWSSQDGLYHLESASLDAQGSFKPIEFRNGEGLLPWKNIQWTIYAHHKYWVSAPEAYFVQSGDGYVGVASYYDYQGVAFWGYKPSWAGFVTFDPNGVVEDYPLSRIESEGLPFGFSPQLIPEKLSKRYATAWGNYVGVRDEGQHSVFSVWLNGIDQLEVPTVPDSSNQMPYLLSVNHQPYWVYMMEPDSDTAFRTSRILMQNAMTGAWVYVDLTDQSIIGPQRLLERVRAQLQSKYIFQDTGEGSNRAALIEPQPVFYKGQVLGKTSVVTGNLKGLTSTVISNMTSSQTGFRVKEYAVGDSQQLRQDLAAGNIRLGGVTPSEAVQSSIAPSTEVPVSSDFETLTEEQLHDLIDRANRELRSR